MNLTDESKTLSAGGKIGNDDIELTFIGKEESEIQFSFKDKKTQ